MAAVLFEKGRAFLFDPDGLNMGANHRMSI
jgi:hypothetical protein